MRPPSSQASTAGTGAACPLRLDTLSHEMRTPFNAIVGWLSILHGTSAAHATNFMAARQDASARKRGKAW